MTRQEFEDALDAGNVRVRAANGNLWSCRRNGKTRTWKRDPARWEIPIKYGFRSYGMVDQYNVNSSELVIV